MNSSLYLKLIGAMFILSLAFASNNPFIYGLAIFFIATLITDLNFISILAAMFWDKPEYFKLIERVAELQQIDNKPTENKEQLESVVQKLKSESLDIKQEKDKYQVLYHFEKTYRLIFGSQITLLNMINTNPNGRMPLRQAVLYWRSLSLSASYSLENYLGFLINFLLIQYNTEDESYSLTPIGIAFLSYLREYGIPTNKLN